ncbi:Cell division protein [Candidatus Palibaumannia cicadellinicola]|uniref:Peptidoglycan D,D-transpeptidase FtsI n=1 Tax=Candidatus Palibaumannia cicadellinicola TaxID=186490 RepID=A0A0K2BL62_9GAMM|nr:Cell division protein [Candidatus Baumannia cicadellinicola]
MIIKKNINFNKTNFVSLRFSLLFYLLIIAVLILLTKLIYIQIINPKKLIHEGDMRSLRVQQVPTVRGMISDRYGRPLAISVPAYAIWADPKEISNHGGIIKTDSRWKILSDVLSIPFNELKSRIFSSNKKIRFVYLARQVNPTIGNYINKLNLPGIYLRLESRRYYPSGSVTANLIGITNIDSQGIEGVEKSFDKWLTGKPGERIVRKDRLGRVIEDISLVNSQAAHNIVLSIDDKLQAIAYREINNAVISNKAFAGTAVLIDIETGEILAMANSPSYNPNNLTGINMELMRNRAITDVFEPGSTVKPMVIIAALKHGIVNENSVINTMPYIIQGHKIKDVVQHNKLSITEILQKSSNIGISKLALSMPSTAILDTYSLFGLGKTTNIGLVGESSGVYPKKKNLSDIETAVFSYGYGVMVTTLQLVRVYATIGNLGILRPLSILKVNMPVKGERIFPKFIVSKVLHMMESVALPGGGGIKAAIQGYRIAIKTGTAKKVGKDGKYINQYVAYTVGVAPASNPRFALIVVVNNPQNGSYYGGLVSAPVFGSIMGKVLRDFNIKPDNVYEINNIKNIK